MRTALGTLPWVEQGTIQTDVDRREVRFDLKDRLAFHEADVRHALKQQGFADMAVRAVSAPG